MKIGGKPYRIFAILALVISSFAVSPLVLATDSQVQVIVGDVCPNIPGNQPTLPSGMQHDPDGNCYTPTPPPPPDACPNLPGNQTAIPSGYYRNASGQCIAQTKPPKDVCPNIDDLQAEVPYGMQTAEDGSCVWPPTDICPNIPGPQATMPKGMIYDASGNCETPPTPAPTRPGGQSDQPAEQSKAPSPLPYYLLGPLWIVLLLLFLQMIRESHATKGIIIIFRQKKRDTETLAEVAKRLADYVGQTASSLAGSISALSSSEEIDNKTIASLSQAVQKLQTNLSSITSEPVAGALESHDAFSRDGIHVRTLRSPLFWLPVGVTAIALIVANLMLGTLSLTNLSSQYIWLQPLALIVVSGFLFLVLRARHIRHIQHDHVEQLVKDAVSEFHTQQEFVHRIYLVLDVGLQASAPYRQSIDGTDFAAIYDKLLEITTDLSHFFEEEATAKVLDAESLMRLLDEHQYQTAQNHSHRER